MLRRAFIQPSPKIIFESIDDHVKILMWPISGIKSMEKGSQIYISKNLQQCDQAHGIPVPEQPITVEVMPSETLFAVADDTGLLGMSIEFVEASNGVNRRR